MSLSAALSARLRGSRPAARRRAASAAAVAGAVLAIDALAGASAASAATMSDLARLRQCESGGNYATNTGNGYYGAYQFNLGTWRGLGFPGYPHQAPAAVQDQAAAKLQAQRGWSPWPGCTRKLGLNSSRGLVDGPVAAASVPVYDPAIAAHWKAHEAVRALVGNATSPEYPIARGAARNHERGQILWSAATGPKAVGGAIHGAWTAAGKEHGVLGMPRTDELGGGGFRYSVFEGGKVVWSAGTGAHVVFGGIEDAYDARGGASGPLGLPTSSEYGVDGGRAQTFQNGTLVWDRASGTVAQR